MKKALITLSAAIGLGTPAYAMTYYLVAQWLEGGNRMCKYGNGTVLNMGISLCPLSIPG